MLGVISDTHLDSPSQTVLPAVFTFFQGVDLILHAGDITSAAVLRSLETIAPVEAVAGNMDPLELRGLLPAKKVFSIEGLTVGLIHGWGPSRGIRERISREFENVQVIVYGHTHEPFAGFEGGVYFFNPGAASRKHPRGTATCGRLTIGDAIKGEILQL